MNGVADLRYPPGRLVPDYLRGAAGLTLTLGPVLLVETHPAVFWGLSAMALLFAAFTLRTVERHLTRVRLDDTGIALAGPLPRSLRWADLSALKLAYYSTRRDREQGWMQLELRAGSRSLAVESGLEGFERVAERAVAAARTNRLSLGEATEENLAAIGLVVPPAPQDAALDGVPGR